MSQPDNPRAVSGDNSLAIAHERVKSFVERVERLEEEKAGIAGDIKDVYTEAKLEGYDAKVLREIVRLRKKDPNELAEHNALVAVYGKAVGLTIFD